MKIVVNTRVLLKDKLDGIGWFTFETMRRITQMRSDDKFYFIFDRPFSNDFIFSENIEPIVIGPPTRHPVLWYYWFEHQLPRLMQKIQPDLFISPDGYLSLKSRVKSLSVIHDINFLHYPNDLPYSSRKFYNHYFPLYAKKANRIATVSEFSKSDIVKNYCINPDKIDVVYNGYNAVYEPVNADKQKQIKEQFSEGNDYFIFIGSLHPRKNVANMLFAYDEFRKKNSAKVNFIIIGEQFFKTEDIKKALDSMQFNKDVKFIGRLEPVQIKDLLASAIALVLVSKLEGFGIPVLESLKCHTPVIVSDITSLPEIAQDSAIYADPFSIESISNAMLKMVNQPALRDELVRNGEKIYQKFNWERTSSLLNESIDKVLKNQ